MSILNRSSLGQRRPPGSSSTVANLVPSAANDEGDPVTYNTSTEPFAGLSPAWLRLPPNWGAWWFVGVMLGRIVLWIFVLGYLMQQRDISDVWHRDQFYWAILVSLLLEFPLYKTLAARSYVHGGAGGPEADVVAARAQGQIVLHVFAFVAFFRTDTAMFARSESGYCAVALIVLLDAMSIKVLRRLF